MLHVEISLQPIPSPNPPPKITPNIITFNSDKMENTTRPPTHIYPTQTQSAVHIIESVLETHAMHILFQAQKIKEENIRPIWNFTKSGSSPSFTHNHTVLNVMDGITRKHGLINVL